MDGVAAQPMGLAMPVMGVGTHSMYGMGGMGGMGMGMGGMGMGMGGMGMGMGGMHGVSGFTGQPYPSAYGSQLGHQSMSGYPEARGTLNAPFGGAHGMGEYGSMMGNQAFGGSNGMAFGQQLGAAHTMLNSHAYH